MKNFILVFSFLVFGFQISIGQIRLSGDEAIKLIAVKPTPVYSDFAKEMNAQGLVKVELSISENGIVNKARVLGGNPSLLTSAVTTAKQYQFKPYLVAGEPTPFVTTVEIFFSLGSTKDEVKNEEEIARRYFTQSDKCRALMKAKEWSEAETICKKAVSIAETLPSNREMEKYSAYKAVSYVLFYLKQPLASIEFSNKALDAAKNKINDNDSETGEIYFLLAVANHNLQDLPKACEFFTKAETVYRKAFENIDDDEIRQPYPQMIKNILEAHLISAEEAGAKEETESIKKRLSELKIQYPKFL